MTDTVSDQYLAALRSLAETLALPTWNTPQGWTELAVVVVVVALLGHLVLIKVCGTQRGFLPGLIGLLVAIAAAVGAAASLLVWAPPSLLAGAAGPWLLLASAIVGLLLGALIGLPWLAKISAGQALAGAVITVVLAVGAVILERTLWQAVAGSVQQVEQRERNLPD